MLLLNEPPGFKLAGCISRCLWLLGLLWWLQVYPFAAEDSERSVLGQGVAYLRDKLGGQLRIIPNEDKPLMQHARPVKGQFVRLNENSGNNSSFIYLGFICSKTAAEVE